MRTKAVNGSNVHITGVHVYACTYGTRIIHTPHVHVFLIWERARVVGKRESVCKERERERKISWGGERNGTIWRVKETSRREGRKRGRARHNTWWKAEGLTGIGHVHLRTCDVSQITLLYRTMFSSYPGRDTIYYTSFPAGSILKKDKVIVLSRKGMSLFPEYITLRETASKPTKMFC